MGLFKLICLVKNYVTRLFIKRALCLLILILPNIVASQTILPTNSSPTGFGVAPLGWTIISGTTDISNKDFWGGISPWAESTVDPPNGHEVWVSGYLAESVGSTISDLTIGVSYTMSFYMCELRYSGGAAPYDGVLQVTLDGIEYLFPFTGGIDSSWSEETFTFTATDETMDISFNYETTGILPNTWCVSFGDDIIEPDCDTLETTISATEICIGEEVTFSATSVNGGLITWDGGISNGIPFTPPLGISTYTATSDFEDDCTFEVEITVLESPDIEIISDDDEICNGDSIIFDMIGEAETFSLDPPDIALGSPYYLEVGSYDIVLTGANGVCETIDTLAIIINENPVVDALVDEGAVCIGETVILSGEGADAYSWDPEIVDGVPFTPETLGTTIYTVSGVDEMTGCEGADSVIITVYELPDVLASADDTEVCVGDLVTLSGEGAATYSWDLGVTDGVAFEPPLGTTTYTVIGTSFLGCENSTSIEITVSDNPDVSISASDTIVCQGEEISLSGTGADTYEWDLGVIDGEAFTPAESGIFNYTVLGTDASGCEETATVTITVIPIPLVTVSASPMAICLGESIIFTGSGADTYSWDGGILDGIPYTPAATGELEFSVSGTDSETGCSSSAALTVTVNAIPEVDIIASTTELCFGESLTLNGSGGETYSWSDGVVDGISFIPEDVGTFNYSVTGVNEFGCEGTVSIAISVIECEPVIAGFEMPNSICIDNCLTLSDTSLGNAIGWEWNFSGAVDPSSSTLKNPTICLNTAGEYAITLNVTSETGAVSTVTKNLIVNPNPVITAHLDTIIDIGGDAELICSASSDGTFNWSPDNNVECSDCPYTIASPNETQIYTVTLIDLNGCKAQDSILVLVNFLLGVGVPTAFSPNNDGNNDVLYVQGNGLSAIYFAVYNRYGEQVFATSDQRIGWDGTFLNRKQNPGVFTWVLQYNTVDGEMGMLKGNTTLIR